MKVTVQFLVLFSTLLSTNWAAPTSQTEVMCTAGDVIIGQGAFITCFFPDDIKNHTGVYMEFYPPDGTMQEVLKCTKKQITSSRCSVKDGFVLRKVTSDTLTVEITAVTERFAGSYVCQFVPPNLIPIKMCNLTVQGTPENVLDKAKSTQSNLSTNLTVVTNVFVIVVILGAVLYTVYNKRYECSHPSKVECGLDDPKEALLGINHTTDDEKPDDISSNSTTHHGEIVNTAKKDPDEVFEHSNTAGAHIPKIDRKIESRVSGCEDRRQPEEHDSTSQDRQKISPDDFSDEISEPHKQNAQQYGDRTINASLLINQIRKLLDIVEARGVNPLQGLANDEPMNQVLVHDMMQSVVGP